MSVSEIKSQFVAVLKRHDDVSPSEQRQIFEQAMIEWMRARGWDQSCKGDPWTDDELRVVLSDAPTKANCLKHALAFKRGYGAIEQIYRWAAAEYKEIKQKGRQHDAFIQQVKRVAKSLGWRA